MDYLPDYYAILGIDPGATTEQVEVAARRLGRRFPEDLRDPSTNIAYKQLLHAYEVLRDPQRRAAYDAKRRQVDVGLEINLQVSRERVAATEAAQLLYLLLTVRAPENQATGRMPVNLCLVFDRSTSMQGARLDQVKIAAKHVVEKLTRHDTISVVAFSDRAEVIVPAGTVHRKELLLRRIERMRAGGGTEIYQGLKLGVQELRKANLFGSINRLVLLTDGHTYGDDKECLDLAEKAAAQGIAFTAFGIGTDWNDKFLDQLVSSSGGHSAHIERPDQILKYLQEQVRGLGKIYAKDLRVRLSLPRNMTCKYAFKMSPFAQPLSPQAKNIALGDVEVNTPLSILFELEFTPDGPGSKIEIPLQFHTTIPSRGMYDVPLERKQVLSVVSGNPRLSPPPVIIRAVQMLNLHRMNEQAWQDVQQGKLEMATKRMQRLTTRLFEAGQAELAQQALIETQRLIHLESTSAEGAKRLKYGTRSLASRTFNPREDDDSMS